MSELAILVFRKLADTAELRSSARDVEALIAAQLRAAEIVGCLGRP